MRRHPAPNLGQHNHEVLAGIGIVGEAFEALARDGIVRGELPVS